MRRTQRKSLTRIHIHTESGANVTVGFEEDLILQLDCFESFETSAVGRLGYTWPTTAYPIGGTAMLALQYSSIGPIHYQ